MRMLAALVSLTLAPAALADGLTPAAAAPTAAAAPAPAGYGKPSGLIPGVVIGPKLNLIGIPPGVGVEARIINRFTLSVDYNFIPTVHASNVKASYNDLSVAARWHPWAASFYLGAAYGQRDFKAKVTDSSGLTGSGEVKGTYIAPEIGWRWIWSSGFFLGMDLGYQFILSPKTTLDVAGMNADDQKNIKDAANNIGKIGFPILTFLQLGFYI